MSLYIRESYNNAVKKGGGEGQRRDTLVMVHPEGGWERRQQGRQIVVESLTKQFRSSDQVCAPCVQGLVGDCDDLLLAWGLSRSPFRPHGPSGGKVVVPTSVLASRCCGSNAGSDLGARLSGEARKPRGRCISVEI